MSTDFRAFSSRPLNIFQYRAETFSFAWVDHLHKSDAPFEAGTKLRMSITILALRTVTNAVGECCFEAVEIGPHHVHALVGNETGQVLSNALAHDACLSVMCSETFLVQNGSHVSRKSLHTSVELCIPGKCQIIGIACVSGTNGLCQASQTAIQSIGAKISKRRRRRCALRKVDSRIYGLRFPQMNRIYVKWRGRGLPHITRRSVGAYAA